MSFIADKQTLDDLNIAGKYRPDSIFNLFNKVKTRGGEQLLLNMFHHPLSDAGQINERSQLLWHFTGQSLAFPFSGDDINDVEEYLASRNGGFATTASSIVGKKILAVAVRDDAYGALHKQLHTTVKLLNQLRIYLNNLSAPQTTHAFLLQLQQIRDWLNNGKLKWVARLADINELSLAKVIRLDHLLKRVHADDMTTILSTLYQLDVYIAVSGVAVARKFCFAEALAEGNRYEADNLRHPSIEKAVGNSLAMTKNANVLFLTGANMAGKSTLMKSFGISVYLAHMGFPIAADRMVFSVKDGLYSSINVPDDLSLGYSHFYAEVMRVKKVAEEISRPLQLVVIFDELFKGTNVKDAYDATLAITEAFAAKSQCLFIISTHITEAGEELQRSGGPFQFVFFPSVLRVGNLPAYTYKLQRGISNDRHGMMIIEKEKIVELIEGF